MSVKIIQEPIYNQIKNTNSGFQNKHITGNPQTTFFKDVYVNPDINQYVRFSPGGNYIIPKDRLLRYSKKFYRKMMEYISWNRTGTAPAEAHLLERALYTMFTCDWEVTEKYK